MAKDPCVECGHQETDNGMCASEGCTCNCDAVHAEHEVDQLKATIAQLNGACEQWKFDIEQEIARGDALEAERDELVRSRIHHADCHEAFARDREELAARRWLDWWSTTGGVVTVKISAFQAGLGEWTAEAHWPEKIKRSAHSPQDLARKLGWTGPK